MIFRIEHLFALRGTSRDIMGEALAQRAISGPKQTRRLVFEEILDRGRITGGAARPGHDQLQRSVRLSARRLAARRWTEWWLSTANANSLN
jgi:hypothetical protein